MNPMTLENVLYGIKLLETINPLDEYAYEKALFAYKTIQSLPMLVVDIQEDVRICRTRTHDTPDLFKNISDISIPPSQNIKNFARCNRPFQSKFYGGETRPTSFMELVEYWAETKDIGDRFYVTTGLWRTTKPLSSIIVTTPDKNKRKSVYDVHFGATLDEFINKYSGEQKEAMIVFYRFLTERFRKPAKHDPLTYLITTSYCNIALLHGDAKAIMYPSVPFAGEGINFAISPDFVAAGNIFIESAVHNELTITSNELGKYNFTETGAQHLKEVKNNGEIIW